VVGPVAGLLGVRPTLFAAGAVIQAMNLLVLAQPKVWSIRNEASPEPLPV
jgi:hypothetical protein